MKKGDVIYLHTFDMNNGIFETYQGMVIRVDYDGIVHVNCKIKEEYGHTKFRYSHVPRAAFGIVGENKSSNELQVFSDKADPTESKKSMTEFLIKRKNKMEQNFDNLISSLEDAKDMEEERE